MMLTTMVVSKDIFMNLLTTPLLELASIALFADIMLINVAYSQPAILRIKRGTFDKLLVVILKLRLLMCKHCTS